MKSLKVLSIIGIVICSIGILGAMELLTEENVVGFLALIIYGYFLAYSIVGLKVSSVK